MGFIKKILGICATGQPANSDCWEQSQGKLKIDLSKTPELSTKGAGVRFEGRGLPQKVLAMHGADGKYYAYTNRCNHIGHRRLDPVDGGTHIKCCSVGGSTYDLTGQRLSGLARGNITPLPIEQEAQTLTISLLPLA